MAANFCSSRRGGRAPQCLTSGDRAAQQSVRPMKKIPHILAFLLLTMGAASAATGLDRHSLQILGITPGESTFANVIRLYGGAKQWHSGDAATSETKICFHFRTGGRDTFVVVASNSEMAGAPSYVVTDIHLYSEAEPFPDASRCASVSNGPETFLTKGGVGLGLSVAELERFLGKPHGKEGVRLLWSACKEVPLPVSHPKYSYWSKREGCFKDEGGGWKGKPYFYVCSQLSVAVKGGKTTYLEISSADSIC